MRSLQIFAMLLCACDVEPGTETAQALTANPCTAVALVAPAGGFSATLGTPIDLSGSATCPVGQTPEFSFWHKRPTDSNWTIPAYVPGNSTFTPPDAGDWCVSVAARAVGSTDSFQVRTGAACGTVTANAPPSTTRTIVVPVVAPSSDLPHAALYAMTDGALGSASHPLVVAIPSTAGSTITAIRARVQDGGSGTRVRLALLVARDNAQAFSTVVTSPDSLGVGVEETIGVVDRSIAVEASAQYFVTVFASSGVLVSNIYRLEIDVL